MNVPETIKKIDEIRNLYQPEDQETLDGWKKILEESSAIKELTGHFAIQDFIKNLEAQIQQIDSVLCNKHCIPEIEREIMLHRKELFGSFISLFRVDEKLQEIEREVSDL